MTVRLEELGTNCNSSRFEFMAGSILMVQQSRQQRDLFESERSFRLLVEGVADYALFMLDPNGIVTSWNIGAQRIKGSAPSEIPAEPSPRFYPEPARASGKPARALAPARQTGRYEEDGWRVRK